MDFPTFGCPTTATSGRAAELDSAPEFKLSIPSIDFAAIVNKPSAFALFNYEINTYLSFALPRKPGFDIGID